LVLTPKCRHTRTQQNAAHLADVITGGAQEQLALDELKPQVKAEMDALVGGLSQEEVVFHVTFALQKKGVKTAQLRVDTVSAAQAPFASEIVRSSTLKVRNSDL
jgi:hypothetical protein